jgi:membrane protein
MLRALARFWRKAYDDNVTGMAAMVAYNMMLSVFPLALVGLFVAGRILESEDVQESVVEDLQRLFPDAADSTLLDGLDRVRDSSTTVGIVAIVAATWFSSAFWGALQGFVVRGTEDLPFGLGGVRGLVYALTLVGSLALLFGILCVIYWRVPRGPVEWRFVWPGAAGALVAMAVIDYAFPLYLANVTSLRVGTSFVFVLIVLVWFYALALILLAGAVVNELRAESAAQAAR